MCDTPAADCEILYNRTYTDPNTYDYRSWNSIDLMSTAAGSPTITQLGGTVLAKRLGLWNSVTYNMSGGTTTLTGDLIISIWSSGAVTSYFNQSGGTMNAGGKLRFAIYTGNTGVYTLSGGNLNVSGNVNLVEDGTTNAKAYLYLNGGTLTTSEIDRNGDNVGQQTIAELHFNGGTLRAGTTDNPNWINFNNGWNRRYNNTVLAIDAGGAIFDTNGRNMGIQQPLPVAFSTGSQISPAITGGGVTKRGAGTLTLSAGNAYTGNSNVEAGTLMLANVNALVNSTAVLSGGPLSFSAITSATLGGLSGSQNFTLQNTDGTAVALAAGNNGANTTYSGAMGGSGSLVKIGGGTLILSGTHTYTGTTSVNGGTLRVNGAVGSGTLAVAANATLGGSGRVNGLATIQNNGHLAPGNSPGTLTFTNGLTLNGGAMLDLELGTTSDLVRVSSGTFSAASGIKINVTDSGGFGYGNYTLIDFTGATPSGISAANFALATSPSGSYFYTLSVQGTKLMLNVAPPPPAVSSVNGPAAGLYGIGKPLDFTVHFSKSVTVTGTPRLALSVPVTGTQYANYVSGSGTADLLFRYTVASGIANNTSGVTLAGSIDANGGGIADAGNAAAAVLALNNALSLAGITLDGTPPAATAITLVGSPPPTSVTISYTVIFSESVTGVAAGAFTVETVDGTATGQLGAVSGSGGTYTVVVTRIGGIGHLFLTLKNSGTGITDLAGNAISGGFRTGDQFQANVQRRCYVSKTAAGTNDGTSWTNAYTDLQSAVRDIGCIEIWTAKGVYKPGSATSDSFQPRAGVKLYGGFAGTETSLDQRTSSVIAANPTVLSGDIDSNDTTDANGVVLDAAQIAGSNSANVILMNNGGAAGYGADSVIDGFVITAGDAGLGGLGGGLRCDASASQPSCSFTLSNLIFSGNRAGGGGALSLTSIGGPANAVVSKTLFRGNRAAGGGGSGGALSLAAPVAGGTVSPAFSNVIFTGNVAPNYGGAIDLNAGQGSITPTFDNATFTGNSSGASRGGAISSEAFGSSGIAKATLNNSILWGDTVNAGDPEIVVTSRGAVALDHSIVQGGCPGGNVACSNAVAGDPKLGTLGNNGGAVPSLLPGSGSAAIDAGTCVLADDIRGVARPQGVGCDIGAVELRLSVLTAIVAGSGNVSAGASPVPMTGGITNCSGTCTAAYNAETPPTVTLTATPNAQQYFSAWSGDCSGTNPVVTVAMTAARTCTATFVAKLTQTALVLSSGSSPSAYGTPLSFTATVAAVAPATQTPTGNVSFYDGTTLLGTHALNGAGIATFTTSALNAGTHSITAQYGGDANYGAAAQPSSAALTQIVSVITPTITWSAPGAIVYGTPLGAAQLNATATYNGNPVPGTFIYTPLAGSVLLAGNAQTLAVTFNPIDTTNYTSAAASVQINVTRAPLTVTGTNAQNKPYDGTATATLSGGTLVGVIPVDASNVSLTQAGSFAQANVGTAIAVTANDSIGGSAAVNYTLTQPTGLSANITALTLTYKATAATIAYGTTPSGLSGTLSGFISGESQATATTGTLSFTTTATASSAPGSYAIDGGGLSANHGNYSFAQDAGNATALTISAAATSTTLTSSPTSAVYGQSVTFTATVSLPSGNSGTAVGKVEFIEGANPLPSGCATAVTVSGGVATCTTQALSVGSHHVVATFTPIDGNTSVSAASTDVSVSAAATTTTITNTQPWTVSLGASTTVNVTVTANAPGSGTPTGTVTVSNGGSGSGDHCTITLPATSCTLTPSSAGTKTVTATYTPDAASSTNFTGSNASASLGVNASQPGTTLISSVNPSVFGQGVTLTGTVTPAAGGVTPTGKVQFFIDGETEICADSTLSATGTANSVNATCTVPQADLSVGDHALRFQYEGDANNTPSTATLLDGTQQTIPQTVHVAQTTTTVTAPASIVLGNPVTIGVNVSANAPGAGIPSGEVAVNVQGQICSVVLDATGAGNCTLAPQAPAGSKTITASYAGSTNFAASSGTASLQVGAAATTTTLTASSATTVYGQSVTFTANVSATEGIVLSGTLAFRDGTNVLAGCGTVPVASGSAQCTSTSLSVSAHTITATYTPTDANTAGSSATTGVTVGKAATITSLSAPPSITLGNPVVVTATVAVGEPGAGTLSGSIAVSDGDSGTGDHCTITLPATSCPLTPSSAGSKTLTAVYSPDTAASVNFTGSSAKPLGLIVGAASPGMNLVSSVNPSTYGQSVTFTATVTPPAGGVIPTGSVVFSDGETLLCAAVNLVAGTSNATAICTTSTLSVGTHVITARYAGDANNQSSSAVVSQVVNKADQTLTFPVQTTPSRTFTVNGTFAIAPLATSTTPNSGQPIVYASKTAPVCSVAGTTVTMLTAGTCTIAADQAGDQHYNAANEVTQSIVIGSAASAITLTASTTTAAVDAAVTLNVTVSGQAPTGTVTINDGGTVLCSQVNLTTVGNTATASCTTSFATAGNHVLTATYAGDANNTTKDSASVTISVGLKCTTMSLTATPDNITAGQSLTLTAAVSGCAAPTDTGGAVPSKNGTIVEAGSTAAVAAALTGMVTFYDGATTLSAVAIDANGNATLSLSTLSAGTHTLRAAYAGDRAFATAQAQAVVVVAAPPVRPVPAPLLDRWAMLTLIGLIAAVMLTRQRRT